MIFETVASGGCRSYLVGCEETCAAVLSHGTEALRTNMSGGKTAAEMLSEAAAIVPFMSLAGLQASLESRPGELIILDVREREAYEGGHVPEALNLPRGNSS